MKNKLLMFFSLLILCQISFAEIKECATKDSIIISLDTINPVISSWGDYVVQIIKYNDQSIIVLRVDASSNDLGELKKICWENNTVYVLTINELLVGYDYFFVIQPNPLKCYVTKPFNYNESQYVLNEKFSLLKKPYYLTIKENGKIKKRMLYRYRNTPYLEW